MRHSPKIVCITLGISFLAISAAMAAAPTEAQQQAIRSNCVKDYRAHCSGVPTGGMDALVCLETERRQPVAGLQIGPSKRSNPRRARLRRPPAARHRRPPGRQPTRTTAVRKSPPPRHRQRRQQLAPASEPKLTFRQEMAIAAGSCATDFRLFCPHLPVGHGNVLFCLQVHARRLAEPCRNALTKLGVDLR